MFVIYCRYMLQYLEEQGFNFRDVDDNHQSPLHCVCMFGHLEAFKFLMRKGVSIFNKCLWWTCVCLHQCKLQYIIYKSQLNSLTHLIFTEICFFWKDYEFRCMLNHQTALFEKVLLHIFLSYREVTRPFKTLMETPPYIYV